MDTNAAVIEETDRLARLATYLDAFLRVERTGSPAGRAALRDAKLDMEAHGERNERFDAEVF